MIVRVIVVGVLVMLFSILIVFVVGIVVMLLKW